MMALCRDRKSRGKETLQIIEGEAKMITKIGKRERERKREGGESDAGSGGAGVRVKK